MTSYPTTDHVIAVHAGLIARFGGSLGIRDRGALESALARPQSGYYQDIIQEATALWESLSQNPVNGYLLEFDDLEAFSFLIGLYENSTMQFVELEKWLRVHAKQSSPRN